MSAESCGCEAVPVIETLMMDHTGIAARAARIKRVLDRGDRESVGALTAELADTLSRHLDLEVAGLFEQMLVAGVATEWVDQLTVQGGRLLGEFRLPGIVDQPQRLQAALVDLVCYGDTQDHELFPYALAALPWERWSLVEDIHQQFLTV